MDIGQIGHAAAYGAIGGAAGALLGALVGGLLSGGRKGGIVTVMFTAAGVVLAPLLAKPLLQPIIGPLIGDTAQSREVRADAALDEALAVMRSDPLLAALLEREPQQAENFREAMRAVSDRPVSEQERAAFVWGRDTVSTRLDFYLARGRDEDLVEFFTVSAEVLDHLAANDPMFCHAFHFNSDALSVLDKGQIATRIGSDRYRRQQEAGAAVIANAFDEIPDYDAETAQLQVNMGGMLMFDMLGEDRIGLLTVGETPASDADARAACEAASAMYRMFLEEENAADILRHLMVASNQ